jgi:hypothetical protein
LSALPPVAFAALRFAATRAIALIARLAESPKRSRIDRVTLRLQLVLAGHCLRGFACDVPTGLSKRLNRRGHLGTLRVTAIELASDGQGLHGLHVLLILDVTLDNGPRCPTHGRNEVTVGPKRRKAGFKPPKLVSQQPGRPALNRLDHAMYSQLRIDVDQKMDVVWHDVDLNQDAVRFLDSFGNDLLEPPIDAIDQHLAPILRTKDHVVLARENDVSIRSVLHTMSI